MMFLSVDTRSTSGFNFLFRLSQFTGAFEGKALSVGRSVVRSVATHFRPGAILFFVAGTYLLPPPTQPEKARGSCLEATAQS